MTLKPNQQVAIDQVTSVFETDNAELKASEAETSDLQKQYDSLKAEYDAYKLSHPDPEPPKASALFGSSLNGPAFKSPADGGLGYTVTDVARVYLRNLPAGSTWDKIINDGTATSDLKDACARANKVIWLSWKEPSAQLVEAFLKTKPTNLKQEVWGCVHHEPENDAPAYSAAQYIMEQKAHSPVARKYGLKFSTILMRYTFSPGSGRNWKTWFPLELKPYVDIFGADSYNTGNKKGIYSDAAAQVAPIAAAAAEVGLPWAIGETGASVFNGNAIARAQWADALAGECVKQGAVAAAWWDQDSYVFDMVTATTWMGKP